MENRMNVNIYEATVAIVSDILSIFVCITLIPFFIFQMKAVLKNMTYIEMLQYEDLQKFGIDCPKNPYDMGRKANLREVLGDPRLLLLCGERSNGMDFQKTYPSDGWPPFKVKRDGYFELMSLTDLEYV
jgi:hypothetical protein